MKVLVLIDAWFPFTGGAQIQIKNLKEVLEKKYKCKFFILHSPSANILVRFLWSFWVIPQSIFLHSKHKFNLIHAHAYWPGIPGKILSKIFKIPIVFTVHGSNLLDLGVKSFRAWLEKIILTKIKYNQVISVASNFLKYKNLNKDNIVIIPNGVDIAKFKVPRPRRGEAEGGQSSKLKILFVGRLEKVKGVDYLIKAFKKVLASQVKVQLIIVGKGPEKRNLVNLAEKLGIKNEIIFKNRLDDNVLMYQYIKTDVFVLPSLSEGQPLTLLEAWAAKLPVIVTGVGENPEMVKNGVNGYLVKPGNADLLTQAILKVLRNKKRDLLGKRGYQLVKSKYTWQNCAKKTYQIYQRTLRQNEF